MSASDEVLDGPIRALYMEQDFGITQTDCYAQTVIPPGGTTETLVLTEMQSMSDDAPFYRDLYMFVNGQT